jgi:hypothetical protein
MTVANKLNTLCFVRGLVHRGALLSSFVILLVLVATIPASAQSPTSIPVFIELRASDMASMRAAIARVEASGGRCLQRFPFRACLGDLPPEGLSLLSAEPLIAGVHQGPVSRVNLIDPDANSDVAIADWNGVYVNPPLRPKALASAKEPAPPPHDALTPPDVPRFSPRGVTGLGAPTSLQTSEYMLGSVAVGIIMPESNGSKDPNTEDWTTSQQDQVVAKIGNSLNWWAQREPGARLSFTWNVQRSVPTAYEPIDRPQSDEGLWIGDVMSWLGYSSSDYFTSVRNYANNLRRTSGTDWAFVVFVVNDANDLDHMFSNGYFAYAYVGGPFVVMTYDNDSYGITNMDAVVSHEIGHIFLALDEYPTAQIDCATNSGYLNAPNSNSEYPSPGECGLNVNSIMRGQISPFTAGAISSSARAELGWRDSTGTGILDPVNTTVTLSSISSRSYTNSQGGVILRYDGQASDNPWTSSSRTSVSINTITGVQYQIDNAGPWHDASPVDGTWDQSSEAFTITTSPLSPGSHTVAIIGFNSACTLANVCNSAMVTRAENVVAGSPTGSIYLPFVTNGFSSR